MDCFVFSPSRPRDVLNGVQPELHNSHMVWRSRCCLMDGNTLEDQVRLTESVTQAQLWNERARADIYAASMFAAGSSVQEDFFSERISSPPVTEIVINQVTQRHLSSSCQPLLSSPPPLCIPGLPCLHPVPSSPSHQGLKSTTMFSPPS